MDRPRQCINVLIVIHLGHEGDPGVSPYPKTVCLSVL